MYYLYLLLAFYVATELSIVLLIVHAFVSDTHFRIQKRTTLLCVLNFYVWSFSTIL